jgi:serine/threonine protein phosphatase PrpC
MSASEEGPRSRRSRRSGQSKDQLSRHLPSPDEGGDAGPFDVDIDIPALSGVGGPPSGKPGVNATAPASAAGIAQAWDVRLPADEKSIKVVPPVVSTGSAGTTALPAISEIRGPVEVPQIVIGTPSPDLEPVVTDPRFRDFPFRPDTTIDGWSNDLVTVRGASLRGHVHRHNGAPRQDDFAIHALPDGRLIALVADGVSSAKQSHLGSTMAVRQATQWLKTQLPPQTTDTDWMALVRDAAYALINQAQAMLQLHDPPDVGSAEKEMATTLLCAVIEPLAEGVLRASIVGVGDSGAWLLRDGQFTPVLGGKTADEGGLSSNAVAGLPRLPGELQPSVIEIREGDVLLLGTDGIGDPLGTGEGGVGNLFRKLFGGNRPPSLIEFAHALDFSRETFDDDRTLVALQPSPAFSTPRVAGTSTQAKGAGGS